jgi:hypothetical protein
MRISEFLVILLITAVASGCLGSESASNEIRYGGDEYAVEPAAMEKGGGFLSVAEDAAMEPSPTTGTDMERKIIQTARISIEVGNFDSASAAVEQLALASGGFVSNSNSYVSDDGHKQGTITIRVPEEGFLGVLEEVKKLGEIKSTSSSGQDVTEEYIDLDSRLRNLERQEERLLAILDNATTVEDVLDVEEYLERVRGDIEVITGRLRYLDERIALATITVEISEPVPITRTWGIRDALSDAVEGFIAMTNGLIIFTGSMIPLAIFVALLYGIFKLVRRKKKVKVE